MLTHTDIKQGKKLEKMVGMIFNNIKEFKKYIKDNFKFYGQIALCKNKDIDDEYFFYSGNFCYSIYVFRGNSHRLYVVETNRQYE